MSKKFSLSLENDEVTAEATDRDIKLLGDTNSELIKNEAEVSEAETIGEDLGKVETLLENSVSTNEEGVEGSGISPETAQAIEIATEHFAKRLGINFKAMPSLESFNITDSRAPTLSALNRVKKMRTAVETSVNVANEGIFTDIGTSISMAFATSEKVLKRINDVVNEDFTEGSTFIDDSWAKYIPTKRTALSGSDMVKVAEDAAKASKSDKVAALVIEFIKGVEKAKNKIRDIWFWSNSEDIRNFQVIGEKINAAAAKLAEESEVASAGRSTLARSFVTPTKQEAKRIAKAVESLLGESSIQPLVKQLNDKEVSMRLWSWWNTKLRFKTALTDMAAMVVGGPLLASPLISAKNTLEIVNITGEEKSILDHLSAEDIIAGRDAIIESRKALTSLHSISVSRVKLASALISYLEKSASL